MKNDANLLGGGGFGKVYRGTYLDQGKHKDVAIKVLKSVDISMTKGFQQEVSTLSCLKHLNIIRFYGICETNPRTSECGIVMEFANLGTLKNHIQDLTRLQASKACLDMFQGLQYLHSKEYIHRDMKLENILLVGDLHRDFTAKIADFGMSRITAQVMTKFLGTPMYMAPELVQDSVRYNNKVDVYSSSIIVFEVFTKERFPFPYDPNPIQQIQAVRRSNKPQMPCDIPRRLQTLIVKGWSRQPQERPKVEEFIEAFEGYRRIIATGNIKAKLTQPFDTRPYAALRRSSKRSKP